MLAFEGRTSKNSSARNSRRRLSLPFSGKLVSEDVKLTLGNVQRPLVYIDWESYPARCRLIPDLNWAQMDRVFSGGRDAFWRCEDRRNLPVWNAQMDATERIRRCYGYGLSSIRMPMRNLLTTVLSWRHGF